MRARLLGAAFAAIAASTPAEAQPAQTFHGVACAAPALLQCTILAPGFDRWIFAPFGIAPPDAEMAAQVCAKDKRFAVASMRRRPVGSGPLAQTTVVEVTCAAPGVASRPAPVITRAPVASAVRAQRPVLAGSPQDFTPQPEGRARVSEDVRRPSRVERGAKREEARTQRREPEAEAIERRRTRAAERKPTLAPPSPRVEEQPERPRSETAARKPAAPEPAPSAAADAKPVERSFPPSKPRRTPRNDPSISYEHF